MDVGDQLRIRIIARIGGVEALLIGEQQQLIRPAQNGGQRREVVVIADFDLSGSHGIVLVDHRHNAVIQQRTQGIAGVEEALAVLHIGTRQQHLAHVDPVDGEELLPELDQAALPDRSQQLLGSDGSGQLRITQVLASGGDRPGGDNNNTMPCGMQLRALAYQLYNMGAVQAARSAR